MATTRHTKVVKFTILKPADGMSWADLAALLREARYRVFRLGNLAMTEHYMHAQRARVDGDTGRPETIGALNQRLRDILVQEREARASSKTTGPAPPIPHERFSPAGALPATITGALSYYKIRALTTASKWRDVLSGRAALPTFRLNGPIYVRCDQSKNRRLERMDNGDVEVDLMVCCKPYPRVVLATKGERVGQGAAAILEKLLANEKQDLHGYRQRCFEIRHDERGNKWSLSITYDFPATAVPALSADRVVGVDLGYACPLFAALNNGHARMGRRQYAALAARIRSLQRQTIARRRDMQRGGRSNLSASTARSGHGRKRKLQSTELLQGRIDKAYQALNHQLSASVIDFAQNHGAGVIQMEDLAGLRSTLAGTFLGRNWRYHQLQEYIQYKAKEAGITVRKIEPRYTSRRCSKCGFINADFDRAARDAGGRPGYSARFSCAAPDCDFKEQDSDYNAARNIATPDIEAIIKVQCKRQGLHDPAL